MVRVQDHHFRSPELIFPQIRFPNQVCWLFKDTDTGVTIFRRLIGDELFPDPDERSLFLYILLSSRSTLVRGGLIYDSLYEQPMSALAHITSISMYHDLRGIFRIDCTIEHN